MSEKTPFAKKILMVLQYLGIYFISLVLIAFAISKFFNAQFQISHYSGHIPLKDTSLFNHAWSFFGRSYNYNLFLGITEFLAGVLILLPRTRLIGLLVALGLYANILIVDIEFNVNDALGHVIVEFIILLLLLIPYVKHLKRFFWDMAGRFSDTNARPNRLMSLYLPLAFIIVLTAGLLWEITTALSGVDKIQGEYRLNQFLVNQDTLATRAGKYTREPMLFFEFNNTVILSTNDSTYWGDYFTKGDSIHIVLDKEFYQVKTIDAALNRDGGLIQGQTDKGHPVTIRYTKPPQTKKP